VSKIGKIFGFLKSQRDKEESMDLENKEMREGVEEVSGNEEVMSYSYEIRDDEGYEKDDERQPTTSDNIEGSIEGQEKEDKDRRGEGFVRVVHPRDHLMTLIGSETIMIVDVENLRKCVPAPDDISPTIRRMLRSFVKTTVERKEKYERKFFVETLVLVDNNDYTDGILPPDKLLSQIIEGLKNWDYKIKIIHLIGSTKRLADGPAQKIEDGIIFGIISTIYSNHKLPRKVFGIFSTDGDFARIIRYYQKQSIPINVYPMFFIPDEETKKEGIVVSKLIYKTSNELDIDIVRVKMTNRKLHSAVV
jgi:hypothetical protein